MMRRLPRGEETLPVVEVEGELLTPAGLEKAHPELRLDELREPASTKLLIERVRMRLKQGRAPTIYRFRYQLTPEEQLSHMESQDDIGLELIEVERKLLEEELRIMRGDYGRS
ncbi:hypothetical protein ES703_78924 [subsurface metagenome]